MAERYDSRFETARAPAHARADIDAGLRSYMLRVYNYMASGVLLTGIIALLTSTSPMVASLLYNITPDGILVGYTTLGMVAAFSPLAFVMIISFGINRLSVTTTQALFWTFAAVMGLSLSSIMFIYTGGSVAKIFFITAAMFTSLSLWGYTTKKDLTGWGSFLFMGLVGIIIASVVNMFVASSVMEFAISIIGVLIFAGLTAYDTQKIKEMYYEGDSSDTTTKKAVMGALRLYLDFINMFLMMLRLFGNRN
ncbi:MAG: Bax inhibitor-1/YccA family protein [Proteobacteria bacterium]|nr:Bax inhibitor-1/YccA family protein [Pseudomonadota bacterium]